MAEKRMALPAPPSAWGEYLEAEPVQERTQQVHRAWPVSLLNQAETEGQLCFIAVKETEDATEIHRWRFKWLGEGFFILIFFFLTIS